MVATGSSTNLTDNLTDMKSLLLANHVHPRQMTQMLLQKPTVSETHRPMSRCHRSDAHVRDEATTRVKKGGKMRLDELCVAMWPEHSRKTIQSWILQDKVLVNDQVVSKAGAQVRPSDKISLLAEELKYVSRAGWKLEAALDHFGIILEGKAALDSGQSTGGFSDCLLQRGVKHVYGIDVGYGQLHHKVRSDPRVTVIERTNLRTLGPDVVPRVDIACLDLSFISVLKCVPAVVNHALKDEDGAELVVLIKPQFEAGREGVERGGVVKDPAVHAAVLKKVTEGVTSHGFKLIGVPIESPIKGDKGGNTEFLAYWRRDASVPITFTSIMDNS